MKIVKIIFWLVAVFLGFCVAVELNTLANKEQFGRYQLATTDSVDVWILDSHTGELWTRASLGLLGDKPHPVFWSLGTPADSSFDIVKFVRENGAEQISNAEIAYWKQTLTTGMTTKPSLTPGMITGIFYNPPNSSALIGGKIVHEAYVIEGVTVVKIHPDKIDFEKNGTNWTQKIKEKPAPAWKTDKPDEKISE